MKYIVVNLGGIEYMFIFPNVTIITHAFMLEAIEAIRVELGMRGDWRRMFRESDLVSAGFITLNGSCYGRSETLNIDSRGDVDSELYKSQF